MPAYIPGPAMIYATAQTKARGRQAGLMAALGLHAGGLVHVAAAAAGLSVLFAAVPTLYTLVKLAGAAYLVWLGISMLHAAGHGDTVVPELKPKTARRAFIESVTVELLNPKTAVFFIAFLSQFVDPAASLPVWAQFLILGQVTNLILSSADLICVALADRVIALLRRSGSAQAWLQRAGGAILVTLGARLAFDRS